MPQKPIFSRPPIMAVRQCFPAAGTNRTSDERISHLYLNAEKHADHPCVLEGLFRLACLFKKRPLSEPVAEKIRDAICENDSGSFAGSFSEQIGIARAAYAMYEYSLDRAILRRIVEWLHFIEIEFDSLILQDGILYRQADLMELLVRFYQTSGVKAALRLCSRLRAESFDWTTALHTFQQTIPIHSEAISSEYDVPAVKPEQIEYDEKEKLINHGLLLADGVRFTLFSGLFSGNGQDLSAGRTVWQHLLKNHHAVCGGTTGVPFLSGNAADQPVSNIILSAWTEAFCTQMILPDFSWAADELIRIVYNGLDDCLNRNEINATQRVNTIREESSGSENVMLYARLTRAVAAAYRSAVSLTEYGFRINYILPARYMIMVGKESLILNMNETSVTFNCRKPFHARVEIYFPNFASITVRVIRNGKKEYLYKPEKKSESGCCMHTDSEWSDQDCILLETGTSVFSEVTHHQGITYMHSGRLLCMPADQNSYARAVCGKPFCENGNIAVMTAPAGMWHIRNGQPSDIPVLPETECEQELTLMKPYSVCRFRITIFPKARNKNV